MTKHADSYLFFNGRVVTADEEFSRHNAALVTAGRIARVGEADQLKAEMPADTREIDLAGRSLLPGFIDTHGHIALFGLDELKISLTGAKTKAEITERLKTAVQKAKPGEWVVAMPIGDPPYFLNANTLRDAGEIPSIQDLDAIAPNNPVYIQAPTNRVPNFAILNTAALAAAGVSPETTISDKTKVLSDNKGKPTGIIEGAELPSSALCTERDNVKNSVR